MLQAPAFQAAGLSCFKQMHLHLLLWDPEPLSGTGDEHAAASGAVGGRLTVAWAPSCERFFAQNMPHDVFMGATCAAARSRWTRRT